MSEVKIWNQTRTSSSMHLKAAFAAQSKGFPGFLFSTHNTPLIVALMSVFSEYWMLSHFKQKTFFMWVPHASVKTQRKVLLKPRGGVRQKISTNCLERILKLMLFN